MKVFFILLAVVLMVLPAPPASAEDNPYLVTTPTVPEALGEVTGEALCSAIINMAPYTVYGSVNTAYFIRGDGIKTRHKSNFRLETGEQTEFCTSGPFYEGRKVELVLRTLVPIFTCKTGVGGDIIISGHRKPEGGTETTAACLP